MEAWRVGITGRDLVPRAFLHSSKPALAHSAAVPFAFFSAMMALQFFIVLFMFPETKGITLEEMQRKLRIA